jgi:uncharacterized protein (UPF0335 family)
MSTATNAKIDELKGKINKLQTLIDNPNTPETDRKNFQEAIKKFEEKLEAEKKSSGTEKPKASASAKPKATPTSKPKATESEKPKATATAKPKASTSAKADEKKMPKGIKMLSKKRVVLDGKEMSTDSKEFCDYLTSEFIKRRQQAKEKKGTRKKTKSVMEQVSLKIEQGVEKAIKTGASNQIPTLKKNPNVFIGKVEKLEKATKNFLEQLKDVLGNDYDAKEVTDTANAIHKMIEDLKNKYAKK